ncbi:MAG TPA: methylenetetrahydrofolate reductase [Acidimicrobiales bacterium]|nr:methylenetetrahydrofolate reductase [Acidimicrobiales bacterium]
MTRIIDLLGAKGCVSIELWPPRSPAAEQRLQAALVDLEALHPAFISITYGAGGSTRERTHDLVVKLAQRGRSVPMAHLVCAGHTRAELAEILASYRRAGIENVLALRGDPPLSGGDDLPKGELAHAVDLAELAKKVGGFCVGVAAHPEGHPDSTDRASDLAFLAAKLEIADFAITQFFFRARDYFSLVEELARLGVGRPIVPGVMPITNARTVLRMADMSGSAVPEELAARIDAVADQPAEVHKIGVEVATELCEQLLAGGVPGLHFYTMNQSKATIEVCANLGIGAAVP